MNDVFKYFEDILKYMNNSLKVMRSTDFGYCNELSIKLMLIPEFLKSFGVTSEIKLKKENKDEDGYCDLLLKKNDISILIELKYVKITYWNEFDFSNAKNRWYLEQIMSKWILKKDVLNEKFRYHDSDDIYKALSQLKDYKPIIIDDEFKYKVLIYVIVDQAFIFVVDQKTNKWQWYHIDNKKIKLYLEETTKKLFK